MEKVEPKEMSEEKSLRLAGIGAACDCTCSTNQYAGANGAGSNSGSCGCYCAHQNSSANFGGANNKLTSRVLRDVISYLQDYTV